jgi:hypothetical protein
VDTVFETDEIDDRAEADDTKKEHGDTEIECQLKSKTKVIEQTHFSLIRPSFLA